MSTQALTLLVSNHESPRVSHSQTQSFPPLKDVVGCVLVGALAVALSAGFVYTLVELLQVLESSVHWVARHGG